MLVFVVVLVLVGDGHAKDYLKRWMFLFVVLLWIIKSNDIARTDSIHMIKVAFSMRKAVLFLQNSDGKGKGLSKRMDVACCRCGQWVGKGLSKTMDAAGCSCCGQWTGEGSGVGGGVEGVRQIEMKDAACCCCRRWVDEGLSTRMDIACCCCCGRWAGEGLFEKYLTMASTPRDNFFFWRIGQSVAGNCEALFFLVSFHSFLF